MESNNCSHSMEGICLHSADNNQIIRNDLSSNGNGTMVIDSSNNTINGNMITNNTYEGIFLDSSNTNTIFANILKFNGYDGIFLLNSNGNVIKENNCSYNGFSAIYIQESKNNKLFDNEMWYCSIMLDGDINTFNSQNISTNNTVCGYPVYYYKNTNLNNISLPKDVGEIILGNVSSGIIENTYISDGTVGILIGYSSNITLYNCTVAYCLYGIFIQNSNALLVDYCVCGYNAIGIYLSNSSGCVFRYNLIINNTDYGFYIESGSHNIIYYNEFYYNHGSGDSYDPSKIQAYDGGVDNLWNMSGYGNYWHDWAMNNDTNDLNSDGIVDFPYRIDGSADATDHYPLKTTDVISEGVDSIIPMIAFALIAIFCALRKPKYS